MKHTAAILMALGLTLPAMTFAQEGDEAKPRRDGRPPAREIERERAEPEHAEREDRGDRERPRERRDGDFEHRDLEHRDGDRREEPRDYARPEGRRDEARPRLQRGRELRERGERRGPLPPRPGRPFFGPPPLMGTLDANHDGVIDEREIDHASEALRRLDKNHDGRLTPREFGPREDRLPPRFNERRERPGEGAERGPGFRRGDDGGPGPERPMPPRRGPGADEGPDRR